MSKRKHKDKKEDRKHRKRKNKEEKSKSVTKRRRVRPIIDSDEEEIVIHEDNNVSTERNERRLNVDHVQVQLAAEVHAAPAPRLVEVPAPPAPEPLDVPMAEVPLEILDDEILPYYDVFPGAHLPGEQPPGEQPPGELELPDSQPPIDESSVPNTDIDPELLKALGDFEEESTDWGEELHEDIAKRFQQILLNGLKKEARDELQKKFLYPKNVTFTKAPTLNPEISTMLTEACRNRDKRIQTKQDQLGKALSALGKAMSGLLKKNPDIPETLRILNDAGKLLSDSHHIETETRRALIIPLVDKSLIDPFKDRKRDNLLFGEKLGELVKDSRGIKRTGQLIQAQGAYPSGSGLNWRGPSSRGRQLRGSQPYPSRAGGQIGQRYQYAGRRRAKTAYKATCDYEAAYAPATTFTSTLRRCSSRTGALATLRKISFVAVVEGSAAVEPLSSLQQRLHMLIRWFSLQLPFHSRQRPTERPVS
ncbi:hypothetical protein NE865_15436 [Phthorimaea operculella]|nr:hypothetical protein NE865_15436 [Phthorimaea operculella]